MQVDNHEATKSDDEAVCEVDLSDILSPVTLPCGRIVPNRLVKASTYEHLASLFGGPPTWAHFVLYGKWGLGNWGMVTTGNVQVSPQHLTLGCDLVIPRHITAEIIDRYKILAAYMKGCLPSLVLSRHVTKEVLLHIVGRYTGGNHRYRGGHTCSLAIMQLSHAGRQSTNIVGGRWPFQSPLAPSATRVGESSTRSENFFNRLIYRLMFQEASPMTLADINETVIAFVRGAKVAEKSGFDGIQLHGAHGYLISQFISRKTNRRTDAFGYPLAFLRTIVFAIRKYVRQDFVVGLKLNVADYTNDGLSEEDVRGHLAQIISWDKFDYIEISGGNYEAPEFVREWSTRQAFFEHFSRIAMQMVEERAAAVNLPEGSDGSSKPRRLPPLIMLTGGLRSRSQFARALRQKHAHLLGVARAATLQPVLPRALQNCFALTNADSRENKGASMRHEKCDWSRETLPDPEPKSPKWWPRIVGAGVGIAWYNLVMRQLSEGQAPLSNTPQPSSCIHTRPYFYSPPTYWLKIVFDMYIEPISEYLYSNYPFVPSPVSGLPTTINLETINANHNLFFLIVYLPLLCFAVNFAFHPNMLRSGEQDVLVIWDYVFLLDLLLCILLGLLLIIEEVVKRKQYRLCKAVRR